MFKKQQIRTARSFCGIALLSLLLIYCGGPKYSGKGTGPMTGKTRKGVSAQASSQDQIEKFKRGNVWCKAREDYKKSGFSQDFRKTYFILEGKELVFTLFAPLSDSSKNLLMLPVVGDHGTFPLSVTYMEQTAYIRNIVTTLRSYYHFSEDSAVTVIASYNGKRLTKCPILTMRASEYIAKTLLKNVLDEEGGMGGE
jgi:hypothetical protein